MWLGLGLGLGLRVSMLPGYNDAVRAIPLAPNRTRAWLVRGPSQPFPTLPNPRPETSQPRPP